MGRAKDMGCGCVVGVVGLLGLVALPLLIGACFLAGKASSITELDADEYGKDRPEIKKPLDVKWMCGDGDEDDPKIVYVPIRGVIAAGKETSFWTNDEESPCEFALRSIRAATRDEDVRGL